jgi:hypothetical protein
MHRDPDLLGEQKTVGRRQMGIKYGTRTDLHVLDGGVRETDVGHVRHALLPYDLRSGFGAGKVWIFESKNTLSAYRLFIKSQLH